MSNVFQRLFVQALTKLSSDSAVVQRAAQKAARAQHDFTTQTLTPASEKAGIWLGAAAREVYLDLKAATAYLKNDDAQSAALRKGAEVPPSGSAASGSSGKQGGSSHS